MNNQALATDQETIRRAQQEWRQAKRREMEAKARKKQYNKRRNSLVSLPQHPSVSPLHTHLPPSHIHPSLYASQAISASPSSISPSNHPSTIQPGIVLAHPANQSSAQITIHPQTSLSLTHHPHHSHPQLHHTNIAPAPSIDHTAAAAFQLQQHLNANDKRTHMALHDSHPDDDPDAAVAARAAAAHAAASAVPGDAQFAQTFANITGQTGNPPASSDPSRVIDLNADRQSVQSEAARRMSEQLEAQRQWREAKRREIAAKRAKGAASKRGRKKARTSAPLNHMNAVGMQSAGAQSSPHDGMAQMHMNMSHAYMRDATMQAAAPISHSGPSGEDHQGSLYESVHDVQNVERMFQGSVDDGVNESPTRHTGSFARPVHAVASGVKRDHSAAVTTELLAATTEAALNAVSEASGKPKILRDLVDNTEQIRKGMEDSNAQPTCADAGGNEPEGLDAGAAGKNSTDEDGEQQGKELPERERANPDLSANECTQKADEVGAVAGIQPPEGESATKEQEAGSGMDSGTGPSASATKEHVTQSESQESPQAPANRHEEGGKDRDSLGFGTDSFSKSRDVDGSVSKDGANSGAGGQSAGDGSQIRMSGDPEGELRVDSQDALEVEAGDGGEDIMTAEAWPSLESIGHT